VSNRLTDAALADLEDIAFLRLSKADREAGMRLDGRAAIDVRDKAASRYLVNLVIELRERRAAALSDEDVRVLCRLRSHLRRSRYELDISGWEDCIAVLDKLIAGPIR
jgi:hypothetical protein